MNINRIKRHGKNYFLYVADRQFVLTCMAMSVWVIAAMWGVLLFWPTQLVNQKPGSLASLIPIATPIALAVVFGCVNWLVVKRFITRVSDFPGATHLLWKDSSGKVHPGTAFWAKKDVEAITIPTITDNVFHTAVRLDRSKEYRAPAHPKGVDVELFFMLRDRQGPLPYGFDPEELYSRMCYRDNQHNVGPWLAGIFRDVVFTQQSVWDLFEEWDKHDIPAVVVFARLMEALQVLEQKHIMPRQSSNVWTMTAIVHVPEDSNVVRFDLDKSLRFPGDKLSAEN